MKGKIEVTIPQRQFENIKITYLFENKEEFEKMKKESIESCLKLHHIVSRTAVKLNNPEKSL